jgi:hypothetical protein
VYSLNRGLAGPYFRSGYFGVNKNRLSSSGAETLSLDRPARTELYKIFKFIVSCGDGLSDCHCDIKIKIGLSLHLFCLHVHDIVYY